MRPIPTTSVADLAGAAAAHLPWPLMPKLHPRVRRERLDDILEAYKPLVRRVLHPGEGDGVTAVPVFLAL